MNYVIKVEKEIDFSRAEKAAISNYKWTEGYSPEAFAQLIYIEGRGFALRMACKEASPKAIYEKYNDPVYKDSCLEFFVSFNNQSPKYMNFEMNSNGAFLAAVRTERANKTPINMLAPLPKVTSGRDGDYWTVEVFFSNDFIGKTFGKFCFTRGESIKGNFYKCGDETEIPHFGMWAPIDSEKPDFHRPEFFGTLTIEE
ncbi:MAG: hypothetical protein E7595_04985 [Ruminococcaceae bacterium]|nr:hypothetical protein [Oscillospiraceae bacterium]